MAGVRIGLHFGLLSLSGLHYKRVPQPLAVLNKVKTRKIFIQKKLHLQVWLGSMVRAANCKI